MGSMGNITNPRSPGSIEFCLENAILGKVFYLAESDVWQRYILWFAVSLHLLPHSLGSRALGLSWSGFGGYPWNQGSGNPHPHGEGQSLEDAVNLVVTCGLYHLRLCNTDILFGSRVTLEKNVLNDFNEVWWNVNNKTILFCYLKICSNPFSSTF